MRARQGAELAGRRIRVIAHRTAAVWRQKRSVQSRVAVAKLAMIRAAVKIS